MSRGFQPNAPFRSDSADLPTKAGLAYIRRQRASGASLDGSRVAWGPGSGLVSLQTPPKRRRVPLPDMRTWWHANKAPSAR